MRRLFTPGWLGLHLLAVTLFGVFLFFGWWQLDRAQAGNDRSWAYTFEWPIFAVFVVVMWVKMMRDTLSDDGSGGQPEPVAAESAVPSTTEEIIREHEAEDPELAAYNRYLARLGAQSGSRA